LPISGWKQEGHAWGGRESRHIDADAVM